MKKYYLCYVVPLVLTILINIVFFSVVNNTSKSYKHLWAEFDHRAVTGRTYDSDAREYKDVYTYYYNYLVDGTSYVAESKTHEGQKILLLYDHDDPNIYLNLNKIISEYIIILAIIGYVLASVFWGIYESKKSNFKSETLNILLLLIFSTLSISCINRLVLKWLILKYFSINLFESLSNGITIAVCVSSAIVFTILFFRKIWLLSLNQMELQDYKNKKADNKNKRIEKTVKTNPYSYEFYLSLLLAIFLLPLTIIISYAACKYTLSSIGSEIAAIIFVFIMWVMMSHLLYDLFVNLSTYIKDKRALKNNDIISGKVMCYCKKTNTDSDGNVSYTYYLVVKYKDINTNEDKCFLTQPFNYVPNDVLGGDDCDVYYYKNHYCAWNFVAYNDTHQPIELEENNSYLERSAKKYSLIPHLIVAVLITAILVVIHLNI